MSIAEKVTQLNTIKGDIKQAIIAKGQAATDDMTQYSSLIENISGGGEDEDARPLDWLTMPTPNADEIYILMQVMNTEQNLGAFSVTCTGNYTVEFGVTNSGGNFTADSSLTQNVASGITCEFCFDYATWDTGGTTLTSDGFKQVMIRITGTAITNYSKQVHSAIKDSGYHYSYPYNNPFDIDMVLNTPSLTSFSLSPYVYGLNPSLQYFSLLDSNLTKLYENSLSKHGFYGCKALKKIHKLSVKPLVDCISIFENCYSLRDLSHLTFDTTGVTNFYRMFKYCKSLKKFPQFSTSNGTNFYEMFYNCSSMEQAPTIDTSKGTNFIQMFKDCSKLKKVETLDTTNAISVSGLFYECTNLEQAPIINTAMATSLSEVYRNCNLLKTDLYLDTSSNTTTSYVISGCYLLKKITLNPDATKGATLGLNYSMLSYNAILELFNSLPTITETQTIYLRGTPGVLSLTAEDLEIATNKGWTISTS